MYLLHPKQETNVCGINVPSFEREKVEIGFYSYPCLDFGYGKFCHGGFRAKGKRMPLIKDDKNFLCLPLAQPKHLAKIECACSSVKDPLVQ